MNKKHDRTLKRIFEKPTRKDITYTEIENLLGALGFICSKSGGSNRKFEHESGVKFHFHEPHPGKEVLPYVVELVRSYLKQIGVES